MKTDDLKKIWDDAKVYVGKYGRAEHHLKTVGKLHMVDVTTQIVHQENPSDQNYWKDTNFDAALDEVIKARFPDFAQEALAILRKRYENALLAEEKQLAERLAQIRAIKEAQ
jgi:hypothetical protein